MVAILAVVTGLGSLLLALRPAVLVPAVVGFLWRSSSSSRPGRRSTRWRRSARIPMAVAGSTASRTRSRRFSSRHHLPQRLQPVSPAPRRSGSCCSSRSAGAVPAPTEEACWSSRRRSPSCSPGSPACGSRPHGSSLGVAAVRRGRARDRRPRRAARRLEPRDRRRRRRPRHAARRPRPASPDLVGRSHVGRPHGVPLPPVARRPRLARHPRPRAAGDRRRCSSRSASRCSSTTPPSTCSATARSDASRSPPGRRRATREPLSERTEASSRLPEPQEHPAH